MHSSAVPRPHDAFLIPTSNQAEQRNSLGYFPHGEIFKMKLVYLARGAGPQPSPGSYTALSAVRLFPVPEKAPITL